MKCPDYTHPHFFHSKHFHSCEPLPEPAITNLSPATICWDTPCLIRFPAAGQKDRGAEKGRGREKGKGKWEKEAGGELWKDCERTSAVFALFAHLTVKYGSQKHIPASEHSYDPCERRWEGGSALHSKSREKEEEGRWEDGSRAGKHNGRKGVRSFEALFWAMVFT